MSIADQTLKALRWMTAGRLAAQIFNWAATLIVIRILDPDDYGLMALALMFSAAAGFVSELGISAALVQRKNLDELQLQQASGLLWLFSALIVVAFFAAANPAAAFFDAPDLAPLLIALSFQFPLTALGLIPDVHLRRRLAFKHKAMIDFIAQVLASLVTLLLALSGWGVWSLVLGNLVLVAARSIGLQICAPWWRRPSWDFAGTRSLLRFGGHLTAGRVLWVLYTNADVFIIGKWFGTQALGAYAIAMQLASLPMEKVSGIVNDVGFSALSRLASEPAQLRRQFLRAVGIASMISFPVFFGMSAVAPELVRVVLGAKWIEVQPLLVLLCLVLPLRMLATLLPTALHAIGATWVSLQTRMITTFMMVAAFMVAAPHGVIGIAWAWLAVFPLCLLGSVWLALPVLGIGWGAFARGIWAPFVAASTMWILVWALRDLYARHWPWPGDQLLHHGMLLLGLSAAGALVYCSLLMLLKPSAVNELRRVLSTSSDP